MKTLKTICAIAFLAGSITFVSCKKQCQGPHEHKKHHDCNHDTSSTPAAETETADS